ncbi:threonine ammonia-lyase [Anaerolineales bacterium HSG6]|nr:threonine ammonia-lyase [Anaerolineales bacterium HSG6]
MITKQDIETAYQTIRDQIPATPLTRSPRLGQKYGCKLLLKLENRQLTGSFKERGALNKLLNLSTAEQGHGVIAASAGNHAQGLAYNATRLEISSKVVMPIGTPLTKVMATQNYGAETILHGDTYDDAFELATKIAADENLTFIPAFDDPFVAAGQGTIALEVMNHAWGSDIDTVLCPVGGGGLIGGIAAYLKAVKPTINIIGIEPMQCASMREALEYRQPVKLPRGYSLADGIAVKKVGQLTYELVDRYVDDLITVGEDQIAQAVLELLETEKLVVEGAGAVPLAALAVDPTRFADQTVLLIISGGNIDVNVLDKIISRGLAVTGRVVELTVRVPDQPGVLVEVLRVFRQTQANVLEVSHHRFYPTTPFGYVDVAITSETKGHAHIALLKRALEKEGYLLQVGLITR